MAQPRASRLAELCRNDFGAIQNSDLQRNAIIEAPHRIDMASSVSQLVRTPVKAQAGDIRHRFKRDTSQRRPTSSNGSLLGTRMPSSGSVHGHNVSSSRSTPLNRPPNSMAPSRLHINSPRASVGHQSSATRLSRHRQLGNRASLGTPASMIPSVAGDKTVCRTCKRENSQDHPIFRCSTCRRHYHRGHEPRVRPEYSQHLTRAGPPLAAPGDQGFRCRNCFKTSFFASMSKCGPSRKEIEEGEEEIIKMKHEMALPSVEQAVPRYNGKHFNDIRDRIIQQTDDQLAAGLRDQALRRRYERSMHDQVLLEQDQEPLEDSQLIPRLDEQSLNDHERVTNATEQQDGRPQEQAVLASGAPSIEKSHGRVVPSYAHKGISGLHDAVVGRLDENSAEMQLKIAEDPSGAHDEEIPGAKHVTECQGRVNAADHEKEQDKPLVDRSASQQHGHHEAISHVETDHRPHKKQKLMMLKKESSQDPDIVLQLSQQTPHYPLGVQTRVEPGQEPPATAPLAHGSTVVQSPSIAQYTPVSLPSGRSPTTPLFASSKRVQTQEAKAIEQAVSEASDMGQRSVEKCPTHSVKSMSRLLAQKQPIYKQSSSWVATATSQLGATINMDGCAAQSGELIVEKHAPPHTTPRRFEGKTGTGKPRPLSSPSPKSWTVMLNLIEKSAPPNGHGSLRYHCTDKRPCGHHQPEIGNANDDTSQDKRNLLGNHPTNEHVLSTRNSRTVHDPAITEPLSKGEHSAPLREALVIKSPQSTEPHRRPINGSRPFELLTETSDDPATEVTVAVAKVSEPVGTVSLHTQMVPPARRPAVKIRRSKGQYSFNECGECGKMFFAKAERSLCRECRQARVQQVAAANASPNAGNGSINPHQSLRQRSQSTDMSISIDSSVVEEESLTGGLGPYPSPTRQESGSRKGSTGQDAPAFEDLDLRTTSFRNDMASTTSLPGAFDSKHEMWLRSIHARDKWRDGNACMLLISMALCAAPNNRLPTRGIADWITRTIPSYEDEMKEQKNRDEFLRKLAHHLSTHRAGGPGPRNKNLFRKIEWQTGDAINYGRKLCWWEMQRSPRHEWVQWDVALQRPVSCLFVDDSHSVMSLSGDSDVQSIAADVWTSSAKRKRKNSDVEILLPKRSPDVGRAKIMADTIVQTATSPSPDMLDDNTDQTSPPKVESGITQGIALPSESPAFSGFPQIYSDVVMQDAADPATLITLPCAGDPEEPDALSHATYMSGLERETEKQTDVCAAAVLHHEQRLKEARELVQARLPLLQDRSSQRDATTPYAVSTAVQELSQPANVSNQPLLKHERYADSKPVPIDLVEALLRADAPVTPKTSRNLFDLVSLKPRVVTEAKRAEIAARKKRKFYFSKEALVSRLGQPFVQPKPGSCNVHQQANVPSSLKRLAYKFDPLPDEQTPPSQEGLKICDTVEEMFGLPPNPIPILDANKQLAFRDGTRNADGFLPRAKVLYPTGFGA